jgi:hypothetical protein
MQPPRDDAARVNTLLTLYREAHYDAIRSDGATLTLRSGEPASGPLLAWIGRADFCAYLTACNPHSQPLSADRNAQRMDALRHDLDAIGARYLRGDGHMPGASWREPSVLVADIGMAALDDLVRRYHQNAILIARPHGVVRLRLYRDDWRALTSAPDLEWA